MQAHDAVLASAQQQRALSMSSFYVPNPPRSTIEAGQQAIWSAEATCQPTINPPFSSSSIYTGLQPVVAPPTKMSASASLSPSALTLPRQMVELPTAESEMECGDGFDDTERSSECDASNHDDNGDIRPVNTANTPIPNLHGGGRGYVPGKTPDDPKKRHKCKVCGRGFARAYNLKVSQSTAFQTFVPCADHELSPTYRRTTPCAPNRTCAHTRLANAASPGYTTSSATVRASTLTGPSSTRNDTAYSRRSLAPRTGCRGAPQAEISSSGFPRSK